MRPSILPLLWSVNLVQCAVNLNGTRVIEPLQENDPSPIGDPDTYYPDQHDCPLACVDYTNMHSWTPYLSVDRLRRCKQPMLMQLPISQPLDDPQSSILIRCCTFGSQEDSRISSSAPVENPKKSVVLFQSSLESAPACISSSQEVPAEVQLTSSGTRNSTTDPSELLQGMIRFFEQRDNCDETFLFGYHNEVIAGIHIGAGLGQATAGSALQALAEFLRKDAPSQAVVELCWERLPEHVLGIVVGTARDLVSVQKMALGWSKGNCAVERGQGHQLAGVRVLEVSHRSNGTNSSKNVTENGAGRPNFFSALSRRRISYGGGWARLDRRSLPAPNADGTCATHLIQNTDTCDKLAKQYGVTVEDLEKWNKGKTWAWTECKDMLLGYNMCVSAGSAPMPPPQEGTECGPLVPGTPPPKDSSTSLADLNPCPLKACCSNWGFCGVFPAHCDVHAPPGGGPGSKEKGFQNTCVSNCGSEIKQNSGAPSTFQRIGYYEAFNFERACLWLKAKDANTDGTYTHIHWAFAEIDPTSWKLVIKDKANQWGDFKKLANIKRIVSIGGWAYSTEEATYNILRSAIISNRNTFAANLAQFVKDEGIDGIDIDWEYPGAPDIMVGGKPIGQKSDGVDYLKFLIALKNALGSEKSVSIAAPASYWYLKAFPIDRISTVIDYVVYMTYDLHGQWDYGNSNAFDSCPSGKCIRSHVNLTETRNSLAMLTKAGVANNKIFVGESSYGRSFHMAQDGCWGPTCDFTGSRTQSDAAPGRCTKTGGYLGYAEINELIKSASGARSFHDSKSDTDVMIYKGDYISFMAPATKDTRREDWKKLNFAGTIDWAVDLQSFSTDDMNTKPERPDSGEGCISGEDDDINSGDLCEFSCSFGFCPESLCTCVSTGEMPVLPQEKPGVNVAAWDEFNVDLNRLCKFACKYGYCPEDVCTSPIDGADMSGPEEVGDDPNFFNYTDARWQNSQKCVIFKKPEYRDVSVNMCKPVCKDALDQANEENRTTNYGCMGFYPLDKPIPWEQPPGASSAAAPGQCICDNMLLNELADTVLEAMPMIAQIGCYILMSSIKLVAEIGLEAIPGVGKALDAGLDMATTAAEMAAYIYPKEEDPEGAFAWWLSPCGGTDLVPEDIKRIFNILSTVAGGVSSFRPPKKIKKGSGKKGDDGNPTDRAKPRPGGGGSGGGVNKPKKKCRVPPSKSTKRMGAARNTIRMQSCVGDKTMMNEMIITSLAFDNNAEALQVKKKCAKEHSQACFHYSSAIRVNPQWATLTCDAEAATTKHRENAKATKVWSDQHSGKGWYDPAHRVSKQCDRDEYPPAYLLHKNHPAFINSGKNTKGQLIRVVPHNDNRKAGQMWKGTCFGPPVADLSDANFKAKVNAAANKQYVRKQGLEQTLVAVTVTKRPEFTISEWGHSGSPPQNDGLNDNPCWPSGIAAADPGFVLLTYDDYYGGKAPPYDYAKPYVQGSN